MFHRAWTNRNPLSRAPLTAFAAVLLGATFMIRPANAQVVDQYDFEDGSAQGWSSFNNASAPANSTDAAESGTHSLLTLSNSAGQGGPGIQLTNLIPGATYTITGFLMLTSGETATAANFTVQRQDPGCSGGTCYDTVGTYQVPVADGSWAQIGGTYTVSTTATSLLLYAQLVGPSTAQAFYLDNVVITQISGPPTGPQDNSGIATNFEDGGLDGWSSRAGSTLTNTAADAHGGTQSLLITNRTAAYDGPQISVNNKMYNGSQYAISVWVKLAPSATQADTLRVSLQTTLQGTTTYHTVVNNTPVPLGTWVYLSIPVYSMAFAYDPGQAFVYVESNSGTQSFYIDDFTLTYLPPIQIQEDLPSISQTFLKDFPVGAEVGPADLSGPHAELLKKHFNSIVSGNDMKWSSTEAQEGQFNFTNADAEVSFAQANGMLIRGHNLVWSSGQQVPGWVFLESDGVTPLSAAKPADVALLTQRIQNHIMNEVQHFGAAIYVWDVVNEPLDPSQSDCLQHGPFYQVLGAKYLEIALRAARQYTPPGTQLFINDYSTTDSNRLACLVSVVRRLHEAHIPLDGVGHEMHNHIDYPSASAMFTAIETIGREFPHLHQQVTELDESVYRASDNTSNYGANGGTVPPSVLASQGWLFHLYFKEFRRLKDKLDAVTFWGFGDDDTWLDSFPITRLDLPLPFDTRLQAKPAYWGIVDKTQLPGFGLSFALTSRTGPASARVWTITATNPSQGIAYSTQITGFVLRQTRGRRCSPHIATAVPLSLGDIAAGASATAAFTINFGSCEKNAAFKLEAPWSSATYETGTLIEPDERP
ncbi:MAG TPA: endo-1,4-beta-xylanase [Steroidobacteraceae bacterium]|nr:endo-1,4-beta-xylanase [Steroidobacteraceae bacterium]